MSRRRSSTLPLVRFLIEPRIPVYRLAEIWVEKHPKLAGITPANPRHKAAIQLGVKRYVPT